MQTGQKEKLMVGKSSCQKKFKYIEIKENEGRFLRDKGKILSGYNENKQTNKQTICFLFDHDMF